MIWEAWQYMTTPVALPYVKPMGFLTEGIATSARAKRCRNDWLSHYQACQNSILQALEACSQTRHCLVFGAGSLQDIPLDTLSERFEHITLVDLVFLPAARRKVRIYDNIELLEHDVTESLEAVFKGQQDIAAPSYGLDRPQIDLVISLNLLTQLPLLPVKWLQSRYQYSDRQADELGQQLMESHLQYLQKLKQQNGAVVCLIADRWVQRLDCEGQLIKEFDPWWEVPKPEAQHEWDWQVMPIGEVSRHYRQLHRVGVSIL